MRSFIPAIALVLATIPAFAQVPGNAASGSGTRQTGHHAACINRNLIRSIDPDGRDYLRFRMETGTDYRSKLRATCSFTPGANQLITHSNGGSSDLCEGDLLDVVILQSGSALDTCQVGEFVAIPKSHP